MLILLQEHEISLTISMIGNMFSLMHHSEVIVVMTEIIKSVGRTDVHLPQDLHMALDDVTAGLHHHTGHLTSEQIGVKSVQDPIHLMVDLM